MSDARSVPTGARGRSLYRQIAVAGFLLLGVAFLMIAVIVRLVFVVVPMGLSLGMAGLVWRFGRWAVLLAAILGLVLAPFSVLLFLFALQSGGRVPLSHTFLILLILAGAFMVLVGSVGAFIGERRAANSASREA